MTRPFVARPAEGLKYPNVVSMFQARLDRSPHAPALRHKVGGVWQTTSWRQWWDAARELAAGMIEVHGLQAGECVAIVSKTRFEWIVADLAIAMAGAISVPVYPSLTLTNIRYILDDSGCRLALCDAASRLAELPSGEAEARSIAFDGAGADTSFTGLRRAGRVALEEASARRDLDARAQALHLDSTLTHVYTSGTTGIPKGVVLTHKNLVYEAWAIRNVVPVDETDEQLLVLPLAHIFARHLVWGAVEQGAVTSIGEGERHIAQNLLEVAPTFMGAVPRMYEATYGRVMREIVGRNPVVRRGFELSLDVGRRLSAYQQRGQTPPTSLSLRAAMADRLFFSRVRELFGGRLRFFVSGGAPLSQEVAEFFHACGVLILQGYGLSETTGATNFNRPDRFRFGTVGPAMPGCEIRIADDGEVLVRGNNVMARYHGLPEDTAAVFDEQGWFKTGDIGLLADGFLRITDRKKDLFKTASGKYIAPRMIEGRLRVGEGIAHAMVYGDGRPHAVAVLALDAEALLRRSEVEGLGCRSYEDLAVHPRIRALLQAHVDEVNGSLARYEAVKGFAIAPAPFSVHTGELTPTQKVKREVVTGRFRDTLEALYDDALPGWPATSPG